MFRLKIALIIGGGVLAWFGFQELMLNSGASSQAVAVDLAELESGQSPGDNHLKIGEHLAAYPVAFGSFRAESENEVATPATKISYCYYPILSESHPLLVSADDDAENSSDASQETFAVLIKTYRFATKGDIPDVPRKESHIQGMVINQVASLDEEERRLVQESFPDADLDKVIILEDGRAPSPLKAYGMTFGGVAADRRGHRLVLPRRRGRHNRRLQRRTEHVRRPTSRQSTGIV